MISAFRGMHPKIAESAFVHEMVAVMGDVHIGEQSSMWPGVVARGDRYSVRIGRYTKFQDGSVLRVATGTYPTIVGDDVTVGQKVILHGCTVEDP